MSVYIYQIGNVALGTFASPEMAGVKLSIPREFRGETFQAANSPVTTFTNALQLPKPMEVSIEGTIVRRNCNSVTDQFNAIKSVGGRPYIDVIAFVPNVCCGTAEGCSECGDCQSDHCANWITTTAFIGKIEEEYELEDLESINPTLMMPLEIDATFTTYWYPLNPYLWETYSSGGIVDGFRSIVTPYNSSFPCKPPFPKLNKADLLFNKKRYSNALALYDVDLWGSMYSEFNARGRGWKNWTSYKVSPSIKVWNAAPASIYAFTNLPASGEIEILVESEIAPWEITEYTSTLDLEEVDTMLNDFGYTGLLEDDIIYVTDSTYSPGFILRNGILLTTSEGQPLKPIWNYSYTFPGQLLSVNNRVTMNTPTQVLSAHLHTFRAL